MCVWEREEGMHMHSPPPHPTHTETQGRWGRGRSSIKACHSTGLGAWLGNPFYCRKNIFYAERIGKWNINVRKVESKASNWDERKYRETAGAGGRIEKHVRVLSLWGKVLLVWDVGRISMVRHKEACVDIGAQRAVWWDRACSSPAHCFRGLTLLLSNWVASYHVSCLQWA